MYGFRYNGITTNNIGRQVIDLAIVTRDGDSLRNPRTGDPTDQLVVRCVLPDAPGGTSWWETAYRDVYAIELPQAEGMVKMLRRLRDGLAKLDVKFGRATDFPTYIGRVAAVLKIEFAARSSDRHDSYDDCEWQFFTIGEFTGIVAIDLAQNSRVADLVAV
jgi:hypothetical protein